MSERTLVRLSNERRILTLLRVQGAMTRAEMARRLLLTPATMTNLVDALSERGLVAVSDAPRRPGDRGELGRPGVDVALNPTGAYFLGVEIGVGVIRFALLNLTLDVVERGEEATATEIAPDDALAIIARHARGLARARPYLGKIGAAVLTVPGLVRSDGFVVHLPILGWRNVDLRAKAEKALSIRTTVENNANAAAFGEVYLRPQLERDCVLHLKLGSGCGGAVILNGRLMRGAFGMAAELGHVRIASDGPPCSCGQTGCLEPHVTLGALNRLMGFPASKPADLRELPHRVAKAAEAGEARARGAVSDIARPLAIGVASLVNAFDPRTVVLGGPMRPVLAMILPDVAGMVAGRIIPGMPAPHIELSRLGEMECAIGAAATAHHRALDISLVEVEPFL